MNNQTISPAVTEISRWPVSIALNMTTCFAQSLCTTTKTCSVWKKIVNSYKLNCSIFSGQFK